MRIDGSIAVSDSNDDRVYTADQIIAVMEGGSGGNRAAKRTTMTASYRTPSASPTVFYTALNADGTVLTSRRTGGVTLSAAGDYTFVQNIVGVDQFIAVWDEGNANDYILERIMVDT